MDDHRPRVLVVDDVPQNIAVFNEVLKRHYDVAAATSGARALQVAQSDPCPDLILLDIVMPEMDGFEVYRRLKEDQRTRSIPVVFLSAKGSAHDGPPDLDIAGVDFLRKPVSPPALLEALKRNLSGG
jgi:putative two-component system response regulator